MRIKIISVGKIKQSFVHEGEQEYLTRMKSFAQLSLLEVPTSTELPETQMKQAEAAAVLGKIESSDYFVVLDERGKQLSSKDFAALLQNQMNQGTSNFCFAIGGASGWDESVRKEADLVLSLSAMTFPYQMTRLILVEQLYRAMTILKGIPYHK
jgi:23S rRNA (pseudouridine1915-N3)-methyltransferase